MKLVTCFEKMLTESVGENNIQLNLNIWYYIYIYDIYIYNFHVGLTDNYTFSKQMNWNVNRAYWAQSGF